MSCLESAREPQGTWYNCLEWSFTNWWSLPCETLIYVGFFWICIFFPLEFSNWEIGNLESSTLELQITSNCFQLTPSGKSRRFWAFRWGTKEEKKNQNTCYVLWAIWQPKSGPPLVPHLKGWHSPKHRFSWEESERHPCPPSPSSDCFQSVTDPRWLYLIRALPSIQVTLSPPPPGPSSHLCLHRSGALGLVSAVFTLTTS